MERDRVRDVVAGGVAQRERGVRSASSARALAKARKAS